MREMTVARIRTVKPEFCTSEQVADVCRDARLLFILMWCFCDDRGVHPDSPKRLKMQCFPADDVTVADVSAWLGELVNAGLLHRFEADGMPFLHVTGWSKHQKIDHPSYRFPEPPHHKDCRNSAKPPRSISEPSDAPPQSLAEPSPPEGKGKERKGVERKAEPRVQAREAEPGKPDAHAVGRKCLEICGWTNDPGKNYAPVHQWLADGADPERHIYPTIRAILAAGKKPKSLAYFTPAITEARTKTTAPPPADPRYAPIVTDYDREMAQWRSRLMVFRDRGSWMASMWGPKPGEPGCKVPKAIIAEHEAAMVAA